MNWVTRGRNHFSDPYRIYSDTRGCSAWIYRPSGAVCLGREMHLEAAKRMCDSHKAKEAIGASS